MLRAMVFYNLFLLLPIFLHAQSAESGLTTPPTLINLLAEHLATGNKIALRDLGKLWDKEPQNVAITQPLKRHTLFAEREWNWETVRENQSFLEFFYENESNLNFSELLQVFYMTPIEERTAIFELSPKNVIPTDPFSIRKIVQYIEQYLKEKDSDHLIVEIKKLGTINNPVIDQILKDLITKKALEDFKPRRWGSIIKTLIAQLPDSLAFDYLLTLTADAALPLSYCQQKLAALSNNFFEASDHQALYQGHKDLWESLRKQFKVLKEYGYQKEPLTPSKFFKEKVDYYAWIAATSKDSLFWIRRNAALDLLETRHPRALFYLAALQFRAWQQEAKAAENYLDLLERHIDIKLKVGGKKNRDDDYHLPTARLNFLIYWANHWTDYEWDNYQQVFTNKQLMFGELDNYDRLFRRLNSTNDSIAQKAFQRLAIGNPGEIQELVNQYKPLFRGYNASLPPFKYKILEQLSQLTHFCKKNNINWRPNSRLLKKLKDLANVQTPKNRYRLENELIQTLTYFDLTPLEYYATINVQNLELNYSIARILDHLYTRFWPAILSNERNLRFYLLKMQLFQNFGGFGIAKKYARKIDLKDLKTIQLLKSLEELETDNRIKRALKELLTDVEPLGSKELLDQLLMNPTSVDKKVKNWPAPTTGQLSQIIKILFLQEDKKVIQQLGKYLELHFEKDKVPLLFEIPQKQWLDYPLAGAAFVQLLERVYNYSFSKKLEVSIANWWDLWGEQADQYTQWERLLFERQLLRLELNKTLMISDINRIAQSPLYENQHRKLCLKSLQKVHSERQIHRLKITPKISVKKELHYLKSIPFSYRELDGLYKILKIDAPGLLLDFIEEIIQYSNTEQQSTLYNNLFRQQWFYNFIRTGNIRKERADQIKSIFQKYLSEAIFLTEFEEQNTQLNIFILDHAGKTLKEKLERIARDSIDEKIRHKYLDVILTDVNFHEIIIAFPFLENWSFVGNKPFLFLSRDFGLPVFEFENEEMADQFFYKLSTYTEYEFYLQILQEFGLDIMQKNGNLDFQKIYDLLQFDLLIPFLGEGGQIRDYYVYGLIKLLELHFKTTLGFAEKLNENQRFYRFNSRGRVMAWRKYLLENQLAKEFKKRSFTQ